MTAPRLLPDNLDRRSAQTELVEDLRDVLERPGDGGAVELLRHDDAVAGHEAAALERCREESFLPPAFHRAVGAQDIDAALVGALGRAARLGEVVSYALVRLVDERALGVYRTEHAHHRRRRRYDEAVAVLQGQVGKVSGFRALGQLEHDAADGPDLA